MTIFMYIQLSNTKIPHLMSARNNRINIIGKAMFRRNIASAIADLTLWADGNWKNGSTVATVGENSSANITIIIFYLKKLQKIKTEISNVMSIIPRFIKIYINNYFPLNRLLCSLNVNCLCDILPCNF
jgi:hypothetical protein